MKDSHLINNHVEIKGEIKTVFAFSHELFGEGFYTMDVSVKRLSGLEDEIPVLISEKLIDVTENYVGRFVSITGQFRSFNMQEGDKRRLLLSVFARDCEFLEEEPYGSNNNSITLDGYICKQPVYRRTPRGKEICDVLLAVNRPYGKSDYIPCICWGRNAVWLSGMDIGDHVVFKGRIQSREYHKEVGDGVYETRVAYEVSVTDATLAM